MTEEDRGFYRGIAVATAALARESGEPALAANVLAGLGIDIEMFKGAKVDGYDMRVLRKLYKTEYVLRHGT